MSLLLACIAAAHRGAVMGGDPYWSDVASLLHFDGLEGSTTFTDQTGKAWTPTSGPSITTAQSMFGGASGYFDGTGCITTPSATDLLLGSSDFTMELFSRPSTLSGLALMLGKHYSSTGAWIILRNGSNYTVHMSSGGSSWDIVNGAVIGAASQDVWKHLAITRQGNTFRAFCHGVQGATWTSSSSLYAGGESVTVGANPSGPVDCFLGYVDEVRITKGVARYTADFTPPTAPFPNS